MTSVLISGGYIMPVKGIIYKSHRGDEYVPQSQDHPEPYG